MARWEHRSVRVNDPALCIVGNCLSCLYTLAPVQGAGQLVECRREWCDNHLSDDEDELPPTPLHKLVALPETLFSPE